MTTATCLARNFRKSAVGLAEIGFQRRAFHDGGWPFWATITTSHCSDWRVYDSDSYSRGFKEQIWSNSSLVNAGPRIALATSYLFKYPQLSRPACAVPYCRERIFWLQSFSGWLSRMTTNYPKYVERTGYCNFTGIRCTCIRGHPTWKALYCWLHETLKFAWCMCAFVVKKFNCYVSRTKSLMEGTNIFSLQRYSVIQNSQTF